MSADVNTYNKLHAEVVQLQHDACVAGGEPQSLQFVSGYCQCVCSVVQLGQRDWDIKISQTHQPMA